jgi:hypothetical protein
MSRRKSGQGLLEGIIAIGALLTGLVAVVTLTASNVASSEGTEARMLATNLAREGLEAVRSVRDANWLSGLAGDSGQANAWDAGFVSGSDITAIAVLDANTLQWTINFTPNNLTDATATLRRNRDRGLYRQSVESPIPSNEDATIYRRLLTIYPICRNFPGNQERMDQTTCSGGFQKVGVKIVSTVQWFDGSRNRSISAEGWLYNWRFAPYVP